MGVLIEAKHRRGELAMYVLPKGLESAWVAARGKGLVFRTGKHGSALVGSAVYASGWVLMCIYLPLVDRHWDGNGHGTFHQVFVVPVALTPHIDASFRARIRSVPLVCPAPVTLTFWKNDPQHLSGLVRRILYQFIGPN